MNGRVYDPVVGRFMSPDNYIQAPTNTQSFNRYSYVLNNPLKYVDPTGWEWENAYDEKVKHQEFIVESGIGGQRAIDKLNRLIGLQVKVNSILKDLKTYDEALYNYVNDLKITNNSGNVANVIVRVGLDSRNYGEDKQVAETTHLPWNKDIKGIYYKENSIIPPISIGYDSKTDKKNRFIGFNITLFGEGQDDATLANEIGAKYYQAWGKNFPGRRLNRSELAKALQRNKRWITSKIKQGYEIYDIGPRGKQIISDFYKLERQIIEKFNYPTKKITP